MSLRKGDPDLWVGQIWRGAGVGSGYGCAVSTSGHESRDAAMREALRALVENERLMQLALAPQRLLATDDSLQETITVCAHRENADVFYGDLP